MGMEARDKITSLLSLVKEGDRNILDVGCGTGELARRLQSIGKSVTGYDRLVEWWSTLFGEQFVMRVVLK